MNTGITTDTSVTELPIATNTSRKVVFGEFGGGRYGTVAKELYRDVLRVFSFSKAQAHAVAERFITDLGQVNAQVERVKFGNKLSKDGERTLKDVVKSIKLKQTWAIRVAFVTDALNALSKEDLLLNAPTFGVDTMEAIDNVAKKLSDK